MKISVCPYPGFGRAQGALLRAEFGGPGEIGFADLRPWPELGEADLTAQLDALKRGHSTPALEAALGLAALDARARGSGQSLFAGLEIPASHGAIRDVDWVAQQNSQTLIPAFARLEELGFTRFKLKLGLRSPSELATVLESLAPALHPSQKLRLDFNARGDEASLHRFCDQVAERSLLDAIDFIEDPTPGNPATWLRLSERYGVRFAQDWVAREEQAPSGILRIFKPCNEPMSRGLRASVVTHSMGHSLGLWAAAWVAARLAVESPEQMEAPGLVALTIREVAELAPSIPSPTLATPEGPGFGGSTTEFESLAWQPWATV